MPIQPRAPRARLKEADQSEPKSESGRQPSAVRDFARNARTSARSASVPGGISGGGKSNPVTARGYLPRRTGSLAWTATRAGRQNAIFMRDSPGLGGTNGTNGIPSNSRPPRRGLQAAAVPATRTRLSCLHMTTPARSSASWRDTGACGARRGPHLGPERRAGRAAWVGGIRATTRAISGRRSGRSAQAWHARPRFP